jgi:putative transposase
MYLENYPSRYSPTVFTDEPESFFALNLADCRSDSLVHQFDLFRDVVRQTHPFEIEATVVLPECLQAIWKLPVGDAGFPTRWMLIKSVFSRRLPAVEHHSSSRIAKGERGIWQCRFWEHLVRDERDFEQHFQSIHFDLVKARLAAHAANWPHLSIHRSPCLWIPTSGWSGGSIVAAARTGFPLRESMCPWYSC